MLLHSNNTTPHYFESDVKTHINIYNGYRDNWKYSVKFFFQNYSKNKAFICSWQKILTFITRKTRGVEMGIALTENIIES